MEYCNDRIFPLLWDFSLAPDEDGKLMELPQDGPVLLKSEFQQFCGKAIRSHRFRVCHCLHRCEAMTVVIACLEQEDLGFGVPCWERKVIRAEKTADGRVQLPARSGYISENRGTVLEKSRRGRVYPSFLGHGRAKVGVDQLAVSVSRCKYVGTLLCRVLTRVYPVVTFTLITTTMSDGGVLHCSCSVFTGFLVSLHGD